MDYETEKQCLRDALAALEKDYRRAAEPYLKRLAEIAAREPPATVRVWIDADGSPQFDVIRRTDDHPARSGTGGK